jgi:hypothetical protein
VAASAAEQAAPTYREHGSKQAEVRDGLTTWPEAAPTVVYSKRWGELERGEHQGNYLPPLESKKQERNMTFSSFHDPRARAIFQDTPWSPTKPLLSEVHTKSLLRAESVSLRKFDTLASTQHPCSDDDASDGDRALHTRMQRIERVVSGPGVVSTRLQGGTGGTAPFPPSPSRSTSLVQTSSWRLADEPMMSQEPALL